MSYFVFSQLADWSFLACHTLSNVFHSRHLWPVHQEFQAHPDIGKHIPRKTELFRRNKVRRQENMSVSVSGLCEGSIYIFLNFLVLFVSRQKGQLKKKQIIK